MNTYHVTFGAREHLRLVEDDRDCRDLLDEMSAALDGALLAYCIMITHAHLVLFLEGDPEGAVLAFGKAFDAYAEGVERERGRPRPLLRGSPVALPKETPFELMRAVRYVHENPCSTRPPLTARPLEWRWSSAREFAGLALAPRVDLARAVALLGPHAPAVVAHAARGAAGRAGRPVALAGGRPEAGDLAGLERVSAPSALLDTLLAAVAEAYGLLTEDLAGGARGPLVTGARATFVRLGRLEGYSERQIADHIGRSQSRASRLFARAAAADHPVRVARTLLRDGGIVGRP